MKKHLSTIFAVSVLLLLVAGYFVIMARESNDFRGITWGAQPEKFKNLKLTNQHLDFKYYSSAVEGFNLGKTNFKEITYVFHNKEGFYMASFSSEGTQQDFQLIKSILIDQLGQPDIGDELSSLWTEEKTVTILDYDTSSNQLTCVQANHQIMQRINTENRDYKISLNGPKSLQQFRGIAWGTESSEISDLDPIQDYDDYSLYVKNNDRLSFGNVKLASISYAFSKETGFYEGVMTADGKDDYSRIKGLLALIFFVPSSQTEENGVTSLKWNKGQGTITLSYDEESQKILCTFRNASH